MKVVSAELPVHDGLSLRVNCERQRILRSLCYSIDGAGSASNWTAILETY